MKIKPLAGYVLVKLIEQEQTTSSGIIMPTTTKEEHQRAEVLAIGKAMTGLYGDVPCPVKIGEKVMFKPYSGVEIQKEQKLLRFEELLVVYDT